jgi:CRP/FNR family transcriptional regulator, cyclic AMP receptor protein
MEKEKLRMSFIKSIKYYNDYKHYRKGEYIFKEGDPGDVMYAVVEGEVEIIVNGSLINIVRPGEVLGEMALIDKKPRSATAVAFSDCKLVVIDEQRFNFLIQQTPLFVTQIMKVMSDRIRTMDKESV